MLPISHDDRRVIQDVSWQTGRTALEPETFVSYLLQREAGERGRAPQDAADAVPSTTSPGLFWIVNDQLPIVTQALTDPAGRLWLRRFTAVRWPEGLGHTWDVFLLDGSFLVAVEVPLDYVFAIGAGGILGSRFGGNAKETLVIATLPQGLDDA